MKRAISIFCFLAAALLYSQPAHADYAVLRSGSRLHITGYELSGQTLRLYIGGGTVDVNATDVLRIEPEDMFLSAGTPAPAVPFGQLIQRSAAKNGVDDALVSSVISAESNFNPRAVSRRNAQGLMQLVPGTAARYSVSNAFDPGQNIEAGTRYLRDLLAKYNGDMQQALAAYNAGPGRVQQYGGIPPYAETQAYVKRVTKKYTQTKKAQQAATTAACYPELIACP
jgi:membrane-bound lytic murein transglycosylase MltF